MRLRQLSRKLEVDTEKIINHLRASNLPCEDDSNAKLSDEQVTLLINEFGPIDEVAPEKPETIVESVADVKEEVVEDEPLAVAEEVEEEAITAEAIEDSNTKLSEVISTLQQNLEEPTAEPDVIRAPKVELTGLKVVGKIELRTPKKKESSEEEGTAEEKVEQPKIRRERSNGRQRNQPRKNTLSIAEQRKREEKIKLRRKKEAEEQAKKKKRENYLKKVKTKEKEKAASKKAKTETVDHKPTSKRKENVGVFSKFFNWMRRE